MGMLDIKKEPLILMGGILFGMGMGWCYHKAMIAENCFGQCNRIEMLPSGIVGYILLGALYGLIIGFLLVVAYKKDLKNKEKIER